MNFIRFLYWHHHGYQGLPGDSVVKNTSANAGDLGDAGSVPGSEKIPWSKKWQATPVFLPGKLHGEEEPGGLQSMGSQRVRHE